MKKASAEGKNERRKLIKISADVIIVLSGQHGEKKRNDKRKYLISERIPHFLNLLQPP
jgi:hypothetical protein